MQVTRNNMAMDLESKLENVHVGMRADLEVSRHLFRSEVRYIILDPVSFQGHALTLHEYEILVRLRDEHPLGEIFRMMAEEGLMTDDRKQEFYEFILTLHQNGLLSLPIVDDKALYKRFEQRRSRAKRAMMFAFLSWRVPLFDPDRFLDRTVQWMRPLFTRTSFILWMLLIGSALGLAIQRLDEIVAALPTLMHTGNLAMMWMLLIALKVVHEFGHAYACKHYGGKVPEMGAYFILMTPCAYVNATASWEFSSKKQRIIVCLAGMYLESILAALATFVWIASEPSLLQTMALQTMIIASVTTIGFNINPLMRFDGYFMFSDLLEIPNLRTRSIEYLKSVVSRFLIGIQPPPREQTPALRATLLIYGVAALAYRLLLIFTISMVLIAKLSFVGLAMAGMYVGSQAIQSARGLIGFLGRREQPLTVRARALVVCSTFILGVPALLVWIPLPRTLTVIGRVEPETYITLTAPVSGTLASVEAAPGEFVQPGVVTARLENADLVSAALDAELERREAELLWRQAVAQRAANAQALQEELLFRQQEAESRSRESDQLLVRTAHDGLLLDCLRNEHVGRFLRAGDPIALIGTGDCIVRIRLTEQELLATNLRPGDTLEYRVGHDMSQTQQAVVLSIGQTAARRRDLQIKYDIQAEERQQAQALPHEQQLHVEIVLSLEQNSVLPRFEGGTAVVRLPSRPESFARHTYRRLLLFVNRLQVRSRVSETAMVLPQSSRQR